jgi:hypothetical protein
VADYPNVTSVRQDSFARRQLSLAVITPIVRLHEYRDRGERSAIMKPLRVDVLALQTLELVIEAQSYQTFIARHELLGDLARLVKLQQPLSNEDAQCAAEYVLNGLLAANEAHRLFEIELWQEESGNPRITSRSFTLLEEQLDVQGVVRIRASACAINLSDLLNSIDPEDAQRAKEALVRFSIASGRYDKARRYARDVLQQTLQQEAALRELHDRFAQNITALNWERDVGPIITRAHAHLSTEIDKQRDTLSDARTALTDVLGTAADDLRAVIADYQRCLQVESRLLATVIPTAERFRTELKRQRLIRRYDDVREIDLAGTVLTQVARTLRIDDERMVEAWFSCWYPPREPRVLDFWVYVQSLLKPGHDELIDESSNERIWTQELLVRELTTEEEASVQRVFDSLTNEPLDFEHILTNAAENFRLTPAQVRRLAMKILRQYGNRDAVCEIDLHGAPFANESFFGDGLRVRRLSPPPAQEAVIRG